MDTLKRSPVASWLIVSGALAACGPSAPQSGADHHDTTEPTVRYTDYYCFVAGTPVLVPGGQVSIDALEVGDSVVAWSESRGEPVVRAVTGILERRVPQTLVLEVGDREIETTEEHPFYSLSEDRWVKAGDLAPGASLARLDGDVLVPVVLRRVSPGGPATVFNLTVEGPEHDFFAGEVLVHNKTPPDSTGPYSSTDMYVRFVNLITDPPAIDIVLHGLAPPWVEAFQSGDNTDHAYGADYWSFDFGVYTVSAWEAGIESQLTALVDAYFDAGLYYTILFVGSEAGGLVSPGDGPMAMMLVDDVAPSPAGTHRLSLLHAGVGMPPVDVFIDGIEQVTQLNYQVMSAPLSTTAGSVEIGFDTNGDDLVEFSWTATLADGDWSYVYALPDGVGGFTLLHHVRGQANAAL